MSVSQTRGPKKAPNVRFLITMLILLLVLLIGSILIVRMSIGGNGGSAPPSTSKEMTPTPTNTPTPTVTPTNALFVDNFVNNSDSWDISSGSGYIRQVSNNALILIDTRQSTILTESLPTNDLFDDFTFTTTLTLVQAEAGDSTGVYVRGDSNLDHDYRIEINGDNTFDIVKEFLDVNNHPQAATLFGPTSPTSLKPVGQQNMLKVIMKGPKLVVLLNNTMVGSVIDNEYSKGQIAFFAHKGSTPPQVKVKITAVEVDPAPAQLPG